VEAGGGKEYALKRGSGLGARGFGMFSEVFGGRSYARTIYLGMR